MNEAYVKERKAIVTRLIVLIVILTLALGGIFWAGMNNDKKLAEGPVDLAGLDIPSAGTGAFVKAEFDRMTPPFAEYVLVKKDEGEIGGLARLYVFPHEGKGLIVKALQRDFNRVEQIVASSEGGQKAAGTSIEMTARFDKIDPGVRDYAKQFLADGTNGSEISDEQFAEYFWPYVFNTDIPKEIGQDNSPQLLSMGWKIYVLLILVVLLSSLFNMKRLKRKYSSGA